MGEHQEKQMTLFATVLGLRGTGWLGLQLHSLQMSLWPDTGVPESTERSPTGTLYNLEAFWLSPQRATHFTL